MSTVNDGLRLQGKVHGTVMPSQEQSAAQEVQDEGERDRRSNGQWKIETGEKVKKKKQPHTQVKLKIHNKSWKSKLALLTAKEK